jgi:hypothetical protein
MTPMLPRLRCGLPARGRWPLGTQGVLARQAIAIGSVGFATFLAPLAKGGTTHQQGEHRDAGWLGYSRATAAGRTREDGGVRVRLVGAGKELERTGRGVPGHLEVAIADVARGAELEPHVAAGAEVGRDVIWCPGFPEHGFGG